MNKFEQALEKMIGEKQLRKIRNIVVGIAGCGGLGSNVAVCLVRSGFCKFILVDFDKIEESNLNRQFYFFDQIAEDKVRTLAKNLKKINPDIKVDSKCLKIDESNISSTFCECDIIVEAFDSALTKALLVKSYLKSDKFIVCGSGLAGYGKADNIVTHKIKKNLVIIGDLESGVDCNPPLAPQVMTTASKMADVILDYVLV